MEKIKEITQEQLDLFKESKNQKKMFKEIVGLDIKAKYEVGDTAVKIDNSKALEVYKNTWKGKDSYYIVIEPMGENLAMAYSLYPVS